MAVGSTDLVPVVVSSELAVGANRFLFSLVDAQNRLIAAPNVSARVRFYDLAADPQKPVSDGTARFIWAVQGERGLYAVPVSFRRAGDWGAEVSARQPGKPERSTRVVFSVRERASSPAVGAAAPRSESPVARSGEEIRRISTDHRPDPDFYRLSIAQAVASRKPSVIAFATPLFCRTRTCGPTLDVVKEVARRFKGRVNFVHVEPYRLRFEGGALQPELDSGGQPQPVPAVTEWGLVTEPYVFVVGASGTVRAKFEGVVSDEELTAAIGEVVR